MDDRYFMEEALKLAKEAFDDGEVPVGCVIVRGDEIVGRGRNRRETDKSALAHAEIGAISEACRNLGGWRLWKKSVLPRSKYACCTVLLTWPN